MYSKEIRQIHEYGTCTTPTTMSDGIDSPLCAPTWAAGAGVGIAIKTETWRVCVSRWGGTSNSYFCRDREKSGRIGRGRRRGSTRSLTDRINDSGLRVGGVREVAVIISGFISSEVTDRGCIVLE